MKKLVEELDKTINKSGENVSVLIKEIRKGSNVYDR